ncbi:MAG: hypothetical protein ABSE63_04375 [Thermoguttaceae bacterium]|jgi:hypothetical protein
MTQIPLDIERVVREVLAELKRAPATATQEPVSAAQTPKPVNGELVLSTRLVTMEEIGDRLGGIHRVVVAPQAVVTPAVRDALRQRNIALSRALPAKNASAAPLRLVIVAARTKMDPKLLESTLQSEGIDVQCHTTDCIMAATHQLAGELAKGDALGLLLTPHTAAALCLANRLAGVRAVLGSNANSVQSDLSAVGANLLIADPQSVSLFKLARMAGDFFRGGIRPCPEVFRKRLM